MFTAVILSLSSIAILILFTRTVVVARRYRYMQVADKPSDLPSVSVCIAARNETHALAQCLERVLKSDYQKLEVLVLDDSSTDDTSLIIKSFASAGVRFIAGKPLPDGWLGKNHAYQTLIEEASGDIIMFVDVDTTVKISSISQLVNYLSAHRLSMLSVLPKRMDIEHASAVFSTFRYYWELLLGTKKSPPAASAACLIKKQVLQADGVGLSNYGMSVRSERHLARQVQRSGQYRYIIGNQALGVGFEKRLTSQWETASRLYYPMSGRNPFSWFLCLVFILLLLAPLFVLFSLPSNIFHQNWAFWLVIAGMLTMLVAFRMMHGPGIWRLRMLVWPLLLVQEAVLVTKSFLAYLAGNVTWKGRNVVAQPGNNSDIRIDE